MLVVFGVMLTSRQLARQLVPRAWEVVWLAGVSAALLAGLVTTLVRTSWPVQAKPAATEVGEIGISLLTDFVGPFELASVLLLVVLLGAAYLARPKIPTIGDRSRKGVAE